MSQDLTDRQRQVLEFIDTEVRTRGYPPSVREIGDAIGLSSSSTVHAHLAAPKTRASLSATPPSLGRWNWSTTRPRARQ